MHTTIQQDHVNPFFQDGGEMGELMLAHDWSQTSVGNIDGWPTSLKVTLSNILHSAFPMFLFWGRNFTCFYNDAFRPSLGIDGKHPCLGKNGIDVWTDVWDFIGPLLDGVMKTGKPAYFEDQLVPFYRNGHMEDIYWTFSYSAAYNEHGEINGVLVTCIETTATVLSRKKIEELVVKRTDELQRANTSLIEANRYLQNIINVFKEPLQVLVPILEDEEIVDFRYKITNAAYAAYANATPEDLQDRKVGDVFPRYFQTSSFENVVKTFKTGLNNTWDLHYNVDEFDLYTEMSATRMGDEVVVHFTDFSKLKNLSLQLENKIKELERSNQNLEEFAYAASHDLKEPIRKILIFTVKLKELLSGHLTENELRTFEKIELASHRMGSLVDDLLHYCHASQIPIEKETVDVSEVLTHVLEDLELDIQQKGAIIHFDVEFLPKLTGYKRQLQQLFQNLISNALKYSKTTEAPRIRIQTEIVVENDKEYVLIEVKDNGIGFSQDLSEKIFKMFVRLHSKNEYSGTGVGLSIVKKVVENHKGFIRVESIPGVGSTFKLYFPTS